MTKARDELAHSGGFVLRTPVLPVATLGALDAGRAREAADADLDAAVARDRDDLADALRDLLRDPVVREAVFVASPDLDEELDGWLAGSGTSDGDRVLRAVLSYLTRMAARSTPFGLFATCAAGRVGGATDFAARGELTRRTRLDYGLLAKLVAGLVADPAIREATRHVPNSSLYRAGGRLRMAEVRLDADGNVRYHRVAIEEDEALTFVLDRAAGGALLQELAAALVDDEITLEEARTYVDELADAQVLLPDLGPAVTGGDALGALIAELAGNEAAAAVREELAGVRAELADLDASGAGAAPKRYRDLADRLRVLEPSVKTSRLVQVDAARSGREPVLGDALLADIHAAVDLLRDITPVAGEDDLTRFREAFTARYEGRAVPLAEALDEEVGVGFGPPPGLAAQAGPLLAGLAGGGGAAGNPSFSGADDHRVRLLRRGGAEVELTADDLKRLATGKRRPLPDSTAVFGSLLGDGRVYVQGVSGPPGARMLGRFCDVDPAIEDVVRRHVADEQEAVGDAVLAEVVHLPEGRIGNILARPLLRAYEIPFLGKSGAPDGAQIPLGDLLVSVEGERIVLRSARLGREVIPRLTTAHNLRTDTLAIYRFLGALQGQQVAAWLGWSWGPLDNQPFLPRVSTGRFVLSRARWVLSAEELAPLRTAKTAASAYRAVRAVREARALPRRVAVAFADNELVVDLTSVGGVELLAHEARRGFAVRLTEPLAAEGAAGGYAHEFVLPLVRRTPLPRPAVTAAAPAAADRDFPPGSEWLMAKLYGGIATSDAILREAVAPLAGRVRDHTDGWFFLRYGDPDHHLRVRFHGDPATLAGTVLPALHEAVAPYVADGRIARVQLDTYRREVERYGGPDAIATAERVFAADSDAVLALLGIAAGDAGLDARWRLALVGIDGLLGAFGLDVAARREVMRRMRESFATEQGALGEEALRHAGRTWRRERAALEPLLSGGATSPVLAAGRDVLARRDELVRGLVAGLPARLNRPVEDVASSHVHMHVNRLLRGAHRVQETVLYDLLGRWYAAAAARARG